MLRAAMRDKRVVCPQCNGARVCYILKGKCYVRAECPLCLGSGWAQMGKATAWLMSGIKGKQTKNRFDDDEEY